MAELAPVMADLDTVLPSSWEPFGAEGTFDRRPFVSPVMDFYQTNAISRASGVMRQCSELRLADQAMKATGTHG
jgi:NADH-quinone oxidoreductase subunit G